MDIFAQAEYKIKKLKMYGIALHVIIILMLAYVIYTIKGKEHMLVKCPHGMNKLACAKSMQYQKYIGMK